MWPSCRNCPKGCPPGEAIKERATLVGYFYKLQGYLEAKAKPRSAPLKAPLLIGLLAWEPNTREVTPPPPLEWNQNWTWLGLGALFIDYLGVRWWLRSGPQNNSGNEQQLDRHDAALIGNWLENPAASELAEQGALADAANSEQPLDDSNFTNSKGS